ncbi:MAG: hypothetical protein IT492_22895 [Gammaproteobacteria bacterium]|nr:hypothetical protein [Gammaproteobacteria bacterium]
MTAQVATLVARLRTGLHVDVADTAGALLYERWVGAEQWPLAPVAVALLVGVAPERWQEHVESLGMASEARQLHDCLVSDLATDGAHVTSGLRLRAWAQGQGVAMPAAAETLLDFVARTLPRLAIETPLAAAAATRATDKEAVLGAALALVTRFTEDCLDEERMFDGARIARLMLAQSALWFADGPPRMSEQAIAELVEHYISGF